ncbi:hypothetical protein JKP88DRAFT_202323 [Tribonema minus]|uniref:J domain-containing protein n=1 Tax=Tribonema minus TaxID=303371 RepID=A0A835YPK0_9STRA|nr:hypothetical protein JKP88DRAFT_202323 [Tribonema minus]
MAAPQGDLYAVLGISDAATKDQIKRAYRKAALKSHPDVSDAPDARVKFMRIVEAYEVLYNDKKRADYDRKRRMGSGGRSANGSGSKSYSPYSSSWSTSSSSSYDPAAAAERERRWREQNPTRDDIDDSFTKIFGDVLKKVVTTAAGGRGIVEDFVEFLESQVDGFSAGGAELDDLIARGTTEELRAEADNARLLARQIKKKLVSVGEECLAAERAAAAGGAASALTEDELDRQMERVDRAAGLRARYDGLKAYLRRADARLRRIERRLDQIDMGFSDGGAGRGGKYGGAAGGGGAKGTASVPPGRSMINPAVENELDMLKKKMGFKDKK